MTDITLLCKVVDNFGDIGVVYRLARALSEYPVSLRIIIDNLKSFHLLCPAVNPDLAEQTANGWKIYKWDEAEICLSAFREKQPEFIIECFQCGRPDWLDNLLFEEKVPKIVNIIMLDYLTAEDYAENFHKLMSLTRSARVKKVNFMPGFTEKTGGLILDKPFVRAMQTGRQNNQQFDTVFFSYPRDQKPVINVLQKFNQEHCDGKLNVLLAKGAGFDSFFSAYKEKSHGKSIFSLTELPFLEQIEWDELLTKCPLLFIRGEDSLSRACLCRVPFIWHAYTQTEEYQLVKVQALLDRMKRHFAPEDFECVEKCWITYNKSDAAPDELENAVWSFLQNYDKIAGGFKDFSESLLKNGDLAEHLMNYIDEIKNRSN